MGILEFFGFVFVGLILLLLTIIIWGYFFGNGTQSLKNKSVFKQLPIRIGSEIEKLIGITQKNSALNSMLVLYFNGMTNSIIAALNRSKLSGYEEAVERHYKDNSYDYTVFAEIIIGYSVGIFVLTNKAFKIKDGINMIKGFSCSDDHKKTILKHYRATLDDLKDINSEGYIATAEDAVTGYILTPQQEGQGGSAILNLEIRTFVLFYVKEVKDIMELIVKELEIN